MMDNAKTPQTPPTPQKKVASTEADAKSVDGSSGQTNQTSHDAKSHTKAGTNQGAGGGKKQERHH
jgi:hypothetical protein